MPEERVTRADFRSAAVDYGRSVRPDDAAWEPDDAAWVRLHNAAIDYVSAMLTNGSDGGRFGGDRVEWLKFVRANRHAFAGVLEDLKYLMRGL